MWTAQIKLEWGLYIIKTLKRINNTMDTRTIEEKGNRAMWSNQDYSSFEIIFFVCTVSDFFLFFYDIIFSLYLQLFHDIILLYASFHLQVFFETLQECKKSKKI